MTTYHVTDVATHAVIVFSTFTDRFKAAVRYAFFVINA
jgi:hypothetical protein